MSQSHSASHFIISSASDLGYAAEVAQLIQTRIRQDVQGMHAYAVQDSRGMVKLDAMENPYTLPPRLQAKLGERLSHVAINRYPGTRIDELREALKTYAQCPVNHELMLGNGSDELISLLAMACDRADDAEAKPVILAPVPGFVMYSMSAALQGLQFVGVDLKADFTLDVPAMLAAIAQHRPAITYLAYPNNPTANLWALPDVMAVVQAARAVNGLVVLDEAYQPFSSQTFMDVITQQPEQVPHVLLMRTLSKFGLAGVRLGYMLGHQTLIAQIDKVRPPYNVSVLNAECALFALEHQDEFAKQAEQIVNARTLLCADLQAIPSVEVFDSDANMVLVRVPDANAVFGAMKQQGILVKNVSAMHPLLRNCLRLTVGTPMENTQMIKALQMALGQ